MLLVQNSLESRKKSTNPRVVSSWRFVSSACYCSTVANMKYRVKPVQINSPSIFLPDEACVIVALCQPCSLFQQNSSSCLKSLGRETKYVSKSQVSLSAELKCWENFFFRVLTLQDQNENPLWMLIHLFHIVDSGIFGQLAPFSWCRKTPYGS